MKGIFSWFKYVDWWLWIPVILLCIAGTSVLTSFDVQDTYAERQLLWIGVGIILAIAAHFVNPAIIKTSKAITVVYILTILILASTLIFADPIHGSRSWFDFGFFSLQSSDIAKLVCIAVLAKYFARRHVEIRLFRHMIVSAVYAGILAVLIALQPDFGSAMIFGALWFGILLISEVPKRYVLGITGIVLVVFGCLWLFAFAPYQKSRIMVFLNPGTDIHGAGYNTRQAMVAIGSGQVFGSGVGLGNQSRLEFLPEYRTDFIFAAFAEEWGFVGSVVVLILLAWVCIRLLMIGYHMQDNFDMLFVAGYVMLLLSHIIVNIGMNVGLLPVTGIPLPFMSYGGTHILVEFIGLGIISSLALRNRTMFKTRLDTEIEGL